MNRLLPALLSIMMLLLIGCAKAEQKPTPKPETVVVPEVSNVPFDLVDLKNAPAVVQKMTMTMEDKEFINWISHNGNGYIILVPDTKNEHSAITIDRIEQRVPDKNYAWLNIKLKYSTANDQTRSEPVIARFDLKNTPNAVGFQLDRLDLLAPAAPSQPPATSSSSPTPQQVSDGQSSNGTSSDDERVELIKGPAIKITEPVPGDAVSSPVAVKGQVGMLNGEVRVRLKDANGKVLAEKPVEIKERQIETALSFIAPAEQQQGVVEAFLINPNDQTEVSRVSIYVTLMPGNSP